MAADINIRVGAQITDLQKKLKQAERSLKRSGSKMQAIGTSLTMSLTAPLGIFGASIISVAADFEKSMNAMKAVTSGGVESFDQLEAKAKELGSTTQFSATQAAGAMEMLGRNGLTAAQILGGAADASLMLAAATGTDLSNAANVATDAMAQFNLKASDLSEVSDLIAGATVNSKFSIDDFQMAMASAGGVAGAVGVTFEDFASTISAISPSFASGADAGTSLKTMLTNLVPASKVAENEMRKLGIITADGSNQFFDASGNMKSMSDIAAVLHKSFGGLSEAQSIQAAKTIFGTDAMRAGLKMAKLGSAGFDKLSESIDGVSAAEIAKTRMEGFAGAMARLKSAFEAFQLAIADGGVSQFATSFVESLTGIVLRLSELNPKVIASSTAILGMVAAIGPVLKVIGLMKVGYANLISIYSSVATTILQLVAKVQVLTVAESRNLIITNAKNRVMAIYNSIHAFATTVINAFRLSTIKSTAAIIAQRIATVANTIAVTTAVAAIQAVIAIETAYIAIKNVLTGKIKLATIAQAALNAVMLANPIALVVAAIGLLVVAFVAAYQNLEGFRRFVDNAMSFIRDKFTTVMNGIKHLFLNLPAYLNASAAALTQFVKNVVSRLKIMALRSKRFMKQFQKAFTINKDTREKLQREIDSIADDEEILADNAQSIADVFNERLAKGIEDGEKLDTKKIKNNVQDAMDKVTNMLGFGSVDGGAVAGGGIGGVGGGGVDEIKKTTEAVKTQAVALQTLDTKQLQVSSSSKLVLQNVEQTGAAMNQMSAEAEDFAATIAELETQLTSIAQTGLQDLAVGFGEGIGAMASGAGNLQTIAGSMLSTIGGVLMQLGKLAIQTGIAIEGIKLALKSLNPAVAVAGGIALVALAKFVQNKAANLSESGSAKLPAFANGGLVTAPTLGMFGEAGPEALIPKKRLDSLLASAENGGNGGVGMLTTRISGNDLEIVLDKTRRRNNRVR